MMHVRVQSAPRRRFWRSAVLAGFLLAAAAVRPEAAAPTDLFFSEYIEGSSNNKALEIYNGTGAPIDLAAGGYNIQMFFNGNPVATLTINLSGTVAAGDVFVLAQSGANATILAQADQTSGSGWFNGDDAVALRKGTTVIDAIGQSGVDPGAEWGSGLLSTADNTLRRKATTCGGDTDPTDAFDVSATWDGLAVDTFGGLGEHTANCSGDDVAPTVTAIVPADVASDVPPGSNVVVTFSEPVNVSGFWYMLTCTASGAKTAIVSGGPTTFTIDPDIDFVVGESCTFTVVAANVVDQDVIDPPDQLAADVVVGFSIVDVCTLTYTRTYTIQGSGAATALAGSVRTNGVVVGDYEGPGPALRGFYIQDDTGDGVDTTSDGLFVFNGDRDSVHLGDYVTVAGTVSEFQDQTQVSAASVTVCGAGSIAPVEVTLPLPASAPPPGLNFLERYEGMLVELPQTLDVTEHFQLGRFGQVVVSSGGRLQQPTNVAAPGAPANALQEQNNLNRLIIDDAVNNQNPDPILFGRNGNPLSASNTLRGGDTATGIVGVMTYTWAGNSASGNAFRVRPIGALDGFVQFVPANPRPAAAPPVAGSLRVASMNLLNFFNTFDGASSSPPFACAFGLGGALTDCRGADDAAEFNRQWPKTVAAITATLADIIGVIEIENDGYGLDSALQFLVDRLNAASGPGTYGFVDVDAATGQLNALGTDAIKVGVVYKRAKVIPIGQTAALNTVAFVNGDDSGPRNRPALAQAFEEFATGARFVVSVNHLKSKGSDCDAPDALDGQGACNVVRTNAATLLAAWLAGDPTGIGDPDVLILGDLNAYAMEDPVVALESASYTNLVPAFGGGHSYVFDGQWGSLDHALANPGLRPQVLGAADWYINADEPSVLDYNSDFKSAGQLLSLYAPDRFRMSDHNPLVVDLAPDVEFDLSAKVSGGGELVLTSSAGVNAGDAGSTVNVALNAKFKKGAMLPDGHINITMRRTESDGVHVFQLKSASLSALVRDLASGRGTVVGKASIQDVTDPSAPIPLASDATLRVTVDDNGEPGVFVDAIAITVLKDGALWFSSHWSGTSSLDQTISGGNFQVR